VNSTYSISSNKQKFEQYLKGIKSSSFERENDDYNLFSMMFKEFKISLFLYDDSFDIEVVIEEVKKDTSIYKDTYMEYNSWEEALKNINIILIKKKDKK